MINKKSCWETGDITHDFEDKYNRKYNAQMLRPDFTIDSQMKVTFEILYEQWNPKKNDTKFHINSVLE